MVASSKEEQEPYETVADYLASLTWDGRPRLDRWLIECAGAEDTAAVRALGRGMLVAAVRRVRLPGCRLDQLPVLVGPSESATSEALRILAVREGWFTDALLWGPRDARRIIEGTAGRWIVEMSEIHKLSDVGALKAFLARTHDEGRLLYERTARQVPRSFLFVGTTSEADFLPDLSGGRRFVPVRVQRFDLGLLREVRDQLWAEAVVVEARGEPLSLGGCAEMC